MVVGQDVDFAYHRETPLEWIEASPKILQKRALRMVRQAAIEHDREIDVA